MSRRTFSQENAFNSCASSASVSVTAAALAARSSPRKLQFCSHMALPPPKKGRVCKRLAQAGERLERLAAVVDLRIDDLVVHAAQFARTIADRSAGRAV